VSREQAVRRSWRAAPLAEERALELHRLPRRKARVLEELDDLGDELLVFRRRFRPIRHPLDRRSDCRVDFGALGELVDAHTVCADRLEDPGEISVRDHGRKRRRDPSRSRVAGKPLQSPVKRGQALMSRVWGILKHVGEQSVDMQSAELDRLSRLAPPEMFCQDVGELKAGSSNNVARVTAVVGAASADRLLEPVRGILVQPIWRLLDQDHDLHSRIPTPRLA
jgi:hypothetical protein